VLLFTAMAWNQTRYWKDSETLFLHVIDVTGANPLAEYSLGQTLQMTAPDRAIPHLQRSIELVQQSLQDHPNVPAPDWYAQSYVAMATAKMMQARVAPLPERAPLLDSAERDLRQALKIDPTAAHAENNLKVAAVMRTQIIPGAENVNALLNEGAALSQQGKFDEAAARFGKATEVDAKSVEAWIYYGLGLLQVKRNADAVAALERAQSIDAKRANDVVTLALRRPADDANLSNLIKSIPR
jgi:tetratricopeptide (TPR) repeat protein